MKCLKKALKYLRRQLAVRVRADDIYGARVSCDGVYSLRAICEQEVVIPKSYPIMQCAFSGFSPDLGGIAIWGSENSLVRRFVIPKVR